MNYDKNLDEIVITPSGSIIRCNTSQKIQFIFGNIIIYYHIDDFPIVIDYVIDFDLSSQCCKWLSQNRMVIQLARNSSMAIFTFKEFSALKNMMSQAKDFLDYETELDSLLKELL